MSHNGYSFGSLWKQSKARGMSRDAVRARSRKKKSSHLTRTSNSTAPNKNKDVKAKLNMYRSKTLASSLNRSTSTIPEQMQGITKQSESFKSSTNSSRSTKLEPILGKRVTSLKRRESHDLTGGMATVSRGSFDPSSVGGMRCKPSKRVPPTVDVRFPTLNSKGELSLIETVFIYPLNEGYVRRIELLCKLGSGTFGDVLMARDQTSKAMIAVKREATTSRSKLLQREYLLYDLMTKLNVTGIPKLFFFGEDSCSENQLMAMQLLGPSLKTISRYLEGQFTLRTVCVLMQQILSIVEAVHNLGFVHRDIKPANFCMGVGDQSNQCFLVDFGFVKPYLIKHKSKNEEKEDRQGKKGPTNDIEKAVARAMQASNSMTAEGNDSNLSVSILNQSNVTHIEKREDCKIRGTARYASIRNHMGVEQSRRDDLETLGYVAIFMLKGCLPWQVCKIYPKIDKDGRRQGNSRFRDILKMKQNTPKERLCGDLPGGFAFVKYLKYCTNLEFRETPDYKKLRSIFATVIEETLGEKNDGTFDWPFQEFCHAAPFVSEDEEDRWPEVTFQVPDYKLLRKYANKAEDEMDEALNTFDQQLYRSFRSTDI
eukprot:g2991.t1